MLKLSTLLLAGAAAATCAAVPAVAQQKAPLSILRIIDADNYDPIRSTAVCRFDSRSLVTRYRGRAVAEGGVMRTSVPMSMTIRSSPISTRPA